MNFETFGGTVSGILIFNLPDLTIQENNSTDNMAITIPKNNPLAAV